MNLVSGKGELCTESLLVKPPYYLAQVVLMHVVSRSFNINKSVYGTNSVSHMLVTSGLLCGSVGEVAR